MKLMFWNEYVEEENGKESLFGKKSYSLKQIRFQKGWLN